MPCREEFFIVPRKVFRPRVGQWWQLTWNDLLRKPAADGLGRTELGRRTDLVDSLLLSAICLILGPLLPSWASVSFSLKADRTHSLRAYECLIRARP